MDSAKASANLLSKIPPQRRADDASSEVIAPRALISQHYAEILWDIIDKNVKWRFFAEIVLSV